jgi:hypothetical protein
VRPRPGAGGCWPWPVQENLLRALLLEDGAAREAFALWRPQAELQEPDGGTFRLLPRLVATLRRLGIEDPDLPKLQGIHRMAWCRNQLLFRNLAQALTALAEAGVPTLVLKGVPLALSYYGDPGERPMDDGDVLVPAGHAERAIACLLEAGWASTASPLESLGARTFRSRPGFEARPRAGAQFSAVFRGVRHGHGFTRAGVAALDLHWRVSERATAPGIDDGVWARARPIVVGGASTLAMAPTDLLLHVLAHGVRWNVVPPLRWVVDAALLLRAPGVVIDWPLLVEEAEARRCVVPVRAGLEYLKGLLPLPVPEDALRALASRDVPLSERWEHRLRTRGSGLWEGFVELAYLERRYREMSGRAEYPEASSRLRFLRHVLGTDRLWRSGLFAVCEFTRRAGAALFRLDPQP